MAKNYANLLKVPQLLAEENSFILKVESMVLKGDVNGAYKLCIENHVNSEENGHIYKISKIYAKFIYRSKNKVDIAGDTHTELDVVMMAFGYIIEGLNLVLEYIKNGGNPSAQTRAENVTCAFYQCLE